MMRSIIQSAPARTTAAIFLTLAVTLAIYAVAWAASATVTGAPANCTGGTNANFTVTYDGTGITDPAYYGVVISGPGGTSPSLCTICAGCIGASGTVTGSGWQNNVPAGTLPGDILTASAGWWSDAACTTLIAGTYTSYTYDCSTGLPPAVPPGPGGVVGGEPPAPPVPAVWLADVCEPLDGFSADGWMTIGSDVDKLPFDRAMYVGPSIDGPWMSIEMPGPPYIMNQETMNVIASVVGVDYHDVWIRISSAGQPARVGSMIIDRGWRMQTLCGG